jgi:hypothetical protein
VSAGDVLPTVAIQPTTTLQVSVAEALYAADAPAVSVQQATALSVSVDELVGVSDSDSVVELEATPLSVGASDSTGVRDAASTSLGITISAGEVVSATDAAVLLLLVLMLSVAERVGVTDLATVYVVVEHYRRNMAPHSASRSALTAVRTTIERTDTEAST